MGGGERTSIRTLLAGKVRNTIRQAVSCIVSQKLKGAPSPSSDFYTVAVVS